jgi:uncharacterized membrane protein
MLDPLNGRAILVGFSIHYQSQPSTCPSTLKSGLVKLEAIHKGMRTLVAIAFIASLFVQSSF